MNPVKDRYGPPSEEALAKSGTVRRSLGEVGLTVHRLPSTVKPMRIIIVEDETTAVRQLETLLQAADPGIEILARLESVHETVK